MIEYELEHESGYKGDCVNCGLNKWQQMTTPCSGDPTEYDSPCRDPLHYADSLYARSHHFRNAHPDGYPDFDTWYARHVSCCACDEGSVYIPHVGAAGPWLCDKCLEDL